MFISWTQSSLCLGILLNSKWQKIWNLGKSSTPGKQSCAWRNTPWQRSHHAQNQLWEDMVNTRCWMGCKLLPTANWYTVLWKQRFSLQFSAILCFGFAVSYQDLQLQQAAAACPPLWDKYTMADVTSGWAGQTFARGSASVLWELSPHWPHSSRTSWLQHHECPIQPGFQLPSSPPGSILEHKLPPG